MLRAQVASLRNFKICGVSAAELKRRFSNCVGYFSSKVSSETQVQPVSVVGGWSPFWPSMHSREVV